jgi:hypothetical protein
MSTPPVVITRKDKKIRHKAAHAAAFAVTGGLSGIVTAAEAASHASYNARTRQLQQRSGNGQPAAQQPPKGVLIMALVILAVLAVLIVIATA